jgi:putative SOS response-associated peptidase YedK
MRDILGGIFMCGRFTQFAHREQLARLLGIDPEDVPPPHPRYNIAPTQLVAVVRLDDGKRALRPMRWGLVPSWADDLTIGNRLINARAETVADKPAFRAAFKSRRCLIPTTGFYEWVPVASSKQKQPVHVRMKDGLPFALAGLWERWNDEDGAQLESCTIITTTSNDLIRPFHDRMPVIIAPADFDVWLDPRTPPEQLHALLRPFPSDAMEVVPVGGFVSNPRNEGPQCLAS